MIFFPVCCYGFFQGWKSLYNTAVYVIYGRNTTRLNYRSNSIRTDSSVQAPSVDTVPFTSDIYNVLDKATSQSDNIICLGDLNCDISNPLDNDNNNNKGRSLLDICDIYDLDSSNNSPTRISSQRFSCVDVILTDVPGYFRESGILEVGLSDHCLVYTVLNKKLPQPKAEIIRVRSFKNFDEGSFCSDLSLVPFSTAYALMILKMYIGPEKNCSLKFWMTML